MRDGEWNGEVWLVDDDDVCKRRRRIGTCMHDFQNRDTGVCGVGRVSFVDQSVLCTRAMPYTPILVLFVFLELSSFSTKNTTYLTRFP